MQELTRRAYVVKTACWLCMLGITLAAMAWLEQGTLLGGAWRMPLIVLVSMGVVLPLFGVGRLTYRRLQDLGHEPKRLFGAWIVIVMVMVALSRSTLTTSTIVRYLGDAAVVLIPLYAVALCVIGKRVEQVETK